MNEPLSSKQSLGPPDIICPKCGEYIMCPDAYEKEIERLTRELEHYDEADRQKTREINLLTPENKRLTREKAAERGLREGAVLALEQEIERLRAEVGGMAKAIDAADIENERLSAIEVAAKALVAGYRRWGDAPYWYAEMLALAALVEETGHSHAGSGSPAGFGHAPEGESQ